MMPWNNSCKYEDTYLNEIYADVLLINYLHTPTEMCT